MTGPATNPPTYEQRPGESQGVALVVEDDPAVREVLHFFLVESGYTVREAETGDIALRMLQESVPDLMLLDLGLPGQSGLAVLQAVRAVPANESLPVVVVSAYASLLTPEQAKLADAVVRKPFDLDLLLAAIQKARLAAAAERLPG